ncbi:hypothetical protein [Nocardia sp. alder85J]|uniref:hypothetical protein n=1 Tax=Nocardia sp. alder85J TaxID=2862949 RepID=UPI001CD4D13E|nr:hypothetical protein [Nocardia sp. alder85J]MCX4098356.1 hypothetical protein [Nocardia sp. alder85J]
MPTVELLICFRTAQSPAGMSVRTSGAAAAMVHPAPTAVAAANRTVMTTGRIFIDGSHPEVSIGRLHLESRPTALNIGERLTTAGNNAASAEERSEDSAGSPTTASS